MKETPHEEGIDCEDKRYTPKDDSKMLVRLIRSDYSKGSEKTVSLLNFNE